MKRERDVIDAMLLIGAIIALSALVYGFFGWRAQAVEYRQTLVGHGLHHDHGEGR